LSIRPLESLLVFYGAVHHRACQQIVPAVTDAVFLPEAGRKDTGVL